jgi:hypothetical protein
LSSTETGIALSAANRKGTYSGPNTKHHTITEQSALAYVSPGSRSVDESLLKSEAYFTQLRPSKEMQKILDAIDAIPTSIFVDSSGNIVGPTVVGSRSKVEYQRMMLVALEEARE